MVQEFIDISPPERLFFTKPNRLLFGQYFPHTKFTLVDLTNNAIMEFDLGSLVTVHDEVDLGCITALHIRN